MKMNRTEYKKLVSEYRALASAEYAARIEAMNGKKKNHLETAIWQRQSRIVDMLGFIPAINRSYMGKSLLKWDYLNDPKDLQKYQAAKVNPKLP